MLLPPRLRGRDGAGAAAVLVGVLEGEEDEGDFGRGWCRQPAEY